MIARTRLQRATGAYGPNNRVGVLSEHLDLALRTGLVARRLPGSTWVYDPDQPGERAVPVVCSELVPIWTEDGRVTGRCGELAGPSTGMCHTHADIVEGWRNQSEEDLIEWERRQYDD